uniref:DNA-directed RNA polymerase n=1 Tax=viral metagenome TaxID=1070528 RepID=A0A6C0C2C6_9ZZZZ
MDGAPTSIASMANAHFEHLLSSWLHSTGLVSHQIQSFNKFLREKLQDIITENSQVIVENDKGYTVCLTFENVFVRPPALREADGAYHRITPHECRLRGLSYDASIYVNVRHTTETPTGEERHKLYTEVLLCRIPCMVRCMACSYRHGVVITIILKCICLSECVCLEGVRASFVCNVCITGDIGECHLDPGGYFIVNGNEKSVIAQEKMRTNFIFVRRTGIKTYSAEVRSLHASKTRSTSTLMISLSARSGLCSETMEVRLPFVDTSIPIGMLFKLLGLDCLHDMCEFVKFHSSSWNSDLADIVRRCLDHSSLSEPRTYLVEQLGKEGTKEATTQRRIRYIEHILSNEFLPHQGLDASPEVLHRKAVFLAVILIKMLRVYTGVQPPDDRDNYALKRIETTGGLFALLFRQLFRQYLKMLTLQIGRLVDSAGNLALDSMLIAKKISAGMKYPASNAHNTSYAFFCFFAK